MELPESCCGKAVYYCQPILSIRFCDCQIGCCPVSSLFIATSKCLLSFLRFLVQVDIIVTSNGIATRLRVGSGSCNIFCRCPQFRTFTVEVSKAEHFHLNGFSHPLSQTAASTWTILVCYSFE